MRRHWTGKATSRTIPRKGWRTSQQAQIIRTEYNGDGHQEWEHEGRLNPATFFRPDDGFIASCTCGWIGQPRLSDEDAQADIREHIAKAHEAWLKTTK